MTKLTSDKPTWKRSVRVMRVLCPLAMVAAALVGWWAWSIGNYGIAVIDGVLVGANAVLTWVQWNIFNL